MLSTKVSRESLLEASFFDTALARRLAKEPVGLIDVGARWGVSPEFQTAAPLFSALAFEPDPLEAKLVAERARAQDWARFACEAVALGKDAGEVDLHLYSRANNSSIFPVSDAAKQRYALGGFDLTDTLKVPVEPLDPIVAKAGKRAGEVIKLDTQGAELDILRGGARTLSERCVCLITEAQFFALYDGAPQFAEIDAHVRAQGLTLIGLSDFQNRSTKRLDKRRHWGRERVFQADAIYFRDPITAPTAAPREIDVAVLMALLLGYFDLALEWASFGQTRGVAMDGVEASIAALSSVAPTEVTEELASLSAAAAAQPGQAHALVGKFVDARRDLTTFHDIPAALAPESEQ